MWTPWQRLEPVVQLSAKMLAEIVDGGQAFRWNQEKHEHWLGIWKNTVCRLRLNAVNEVEWSCLEEQQQLYPQILNTYLANDQNWKQISDSLPWRSDPILQQCMSTLPGLRILKQPFEETLLNFLCSSTKQIPQIKQMAEHLARRLGTPIGATDYYSLPSWEAISTRSETDLRNCKLGYRAKFIKATADLLAHSPQILDTAKTAPYEKAKKALMGLPGVGEKIADCVLLFGGAHYEAFPVDTWIAKAMTKRYRLHDWNLKNIAAFGRIHYGPYAGFAQQFLFSGERQSVHEKKD